MVKGVTYHVLNDHTLGYINELQPQVFGILSGDVHGLNWKDGTTILSPNSVLRPATLEDFKRFRVDSTGHLEQPHRCLSYECCEEEEKPDWADYPAASWCKGTHVDGKACGECGPTLEAHLDSKWENGT